MESNDNLLNDMSMPPNTEYQKAILLNTAHIFAKVNKHIEAETKKDAKNITNLVKYAPYIFTKEGIGELIGVELIGDFSEYTDPDNEELLMLSTSLLFIELTRLFLDEAVGIDQVVYAIKYTNEASFWLGSYETLKAANADNKLQRTVTAKKAAAKKHQKSAEYKKKVIEHYRHNGYKSKDQAAEKLIKEMRVPYAFRTVRQWLNNVK